MEPSDYYDAPMKNVLHFIRDVGLIKGSQKAKHNRSLKVAVQGPDLTAQPSHPHTHAHAHTSLTKLQMLVSHTILR
jgi:hypothetical protein